MPISVFVVDDHVLVRQSLVQLLSCEPDITIVGEGSGMNETVARIGATNAEVVVLDLEMPGLRGPDLIRLLKAADPAPRVLVCSMHGTYAHVAEALRAGAEGYVLKSSPAELLLAGIRRVASGEGHIDPALQRDVIGLLQRRDTGRLDVELTTREIESLQLAANGLSNEEISHETGQSLETVKLRFRRSFRKLGAVDRTSAVAAALRRKLIY